jgi:hypothetical protein
MTAAGQGVIATGKLGDDDSMLVSSHNTRRQGFRSELLILAFYWLCSAVLVPLFVGSLTRYIESDALHGAVILTQRGE